MANERDALSNFQFPKTKGLFVNFEDGKPIKLRVLTVDPLVSMDKWGNTRFAFVVYNWTDAKAQILNRGTSIAKEIQALHQNEDWGSDIKKIDIQITASGAGKDTRYAITPLPKAETLTNEQIKECQEIKLEDKIENGQRMSFYDPSKFEAPTEELSGYEKAKGVAEGLKEDSIEDVEGEELINLDDIPF